MRATRTARGPFAAFAAFGLFWGAWGVLLPDIKAATGASAGQLGLALLFIGVGALPAMLLTGLLVDRLGGRALPAALVAFGLVVGLPAVAGSVVQLSVVLLVVGAASGAVDVAMNAAAAAGEASGGRRAMQKAHGSFSAAVVVAAVTVGLARQLGASPWQVLLGAAVALLAAAWANRGAGEGAPPSRRVAARPILSPALTLLGALAATGFVFESGVQNWSALYLEQILGASPAIGGLAPALFAAAMALGRIFGDRLAARVGDRRLLGAGSFVGGVGLLMAARASAVPVALLGFGVAGAGIAVVAPSLFGAAGRGADEGERGSSVASVTTIAYLGFLAGPPLMGAVSGAAGLRIGWLALAATALVIAGATVTLRPVRTALAPRRGRRLS